MWTMLQLNDPPDLVIAKGRSVSQGYFASAAFSAFGLNRRPRVRRYRALLRPSDVQYGAADPGLAWRRLGWRATFDVHRVVAQVCRAAIGVALVDEGSK